MKQGSRLLRYCYNSIVLAALIVHAKGWTMDRRTCLELLQLVQLMDIPSSSKANKELTKPVMPENVEITDRVFMDVRIARTDGSTYVRDDLPDTFDNRVLFQRINFGLYGKLAPNHAGKFLSYVVPPDGDNDVENPYPSYSRSTFPALDQGTGLLLAGNIASLRYVPFRLDDPGGDGATLQPLPHSLAYCGATAEPRMLLGPPP